VLSLHNSCSCHLSTMRIMNLSILNHHSVIENISSKLVTLLYESRCHHALLCRSEYFDEPIGKLNIPHSEGNGPQKRVHLLSNPCMFQVNEVLFGVTSNDVLFGLSSDEASANIPGSMRLQRLASHLLQQQSFSPQFPPPPSSMAQV
jgi:hypothetical protein